MSRGVDQRRRVTVVVLSVVVAAVCTPSLARAAGPPQVTETWATDVNAVVADLHARINPNGLATSYHFSYITEAAYQANLNAAKDGFAGAAKAPIAADPVLVAGETAQPVVQHVALFKAATTYRYRAVAKNSAGEMSGPTRTLTTRAAVGGSLVLPDGRAWEMVSPVEKGGGEVEGPGGIAGGGVFQAAPDGGAFTFSSSASFGAAAGAPPASQYVAGRTGSGWSTENVSGPLLSAGYPDTGDRVPYQLFSADLSVGLLSNGQRCRGAGTGCPVPNPPPPGVDAPAGYRNYYLRSHLGASYQALLTAANSSSLAIPAEDFELDLEGATPDLRHLAVSTCAALAADAVEAVTPDGCDTAGPNLYLWSAGRLETVNLLPGQTLSSPGAALAAQSGAISADGSRVYWTDLGSGNLYLREGGSETAQVDAAVGGGGRFETASLDGGIAFFTKAGGLYRYVAATAAVTDLTPGGGGVEGVLGASADGSHLYYLTAAGLQHSYAGTTTQIAAAADLSNTPPATGTARVTASGSHLAFLSSALLGEYDNDGMSQVYLYDAAAKRLTCVSCNPTGARPLGPSSIPGSVANGELPSSTDLYKPRALSADGRRVFFDSADSLVSQDTDGRPDVYQWEAEGTGSCATPGGCVHLLSGGRLAGGSLLDASSDGSSVFFLTRDSLLARDPGSLDVYVARVGGGFPEPVPPIPCNGDACQGPAPGPEDSVPGTATLLAPSNPPPVFAKRPGRKGKKGKGKGKGKGAKKHQQGKAGKRGGARGEKGSRR